MGPTAEPSASATPNRAPLPLETRRALPDYDGRPDVPEGDDAGLWTARVLMSPAWLASEGLVRQPVHGAFWAAEEVELIGAVADTSTQDADDAVGLTPVGVIEAGEHPMIGMYTQIEHLLAPSERLRGVAMIGGIDVMRVHLVDEVRLLPHAHLELGFSGIRRDDLVFWGVGARADEADQRDYEVSLVAGRARFHVELAPRDLVSVESWMNVRRAHIGRDDDGALPPGNGGTTTLATGGHFAVDAPPPAGGGTSLGGGLVLSGEQLGIVAGPGDGGWIRWGGRGRLAADITGTRRVLSLGAQLEFADPLQADVEIPVLDLPGAQRLESDLEGDLLLGVRPGRTVGRSLFQTAIDYQWPVWSLLDAHLQVGTGNAFGAHLQDFEPGLLRFAFAGGLTANIRRDFSLLALVGFSTETFEDGTEPALARVLIGAASNL